MVNYGSSISGLKAASLSSNVTAHNLANVGTAGFKASTASNLAGQGYTGISNSAVQTNFSQGSVTTTGNSLNLAISGQGFLSVATQNGTAYTRNGSLQLNNQGKLTDMSGNPLKPEITIPANASSISINGKGNVSAMLNGNQQQVGQINLTKFANPGGLNALGNSLFGATPASGQPITGLPDTAGLGSFMSGALETSNVDIAENMVNLVIDKNAFKANTNAFKAQDEMMQTALDIIA